VAVAVPVPVGLGWCVFSWELSERGELDSVLGVARGEGEWEGVEREGVRRSAG